MGYDVSNGTAWAVLSSVLIVFTILAIGATDRFPCVPQALRNLLLLKKHGSEAQTADYFLSARDAAGTWAIALSYFASGMGAWVVYGSTEMGATPQLSWLGVLGYSGASSFPAVLVCILGPMIREQTQNHQAFSTSDFGRQRYGRVMQFSIACMSIFYMFIYIVAELTSIANVFKLLTNNFSMAFGIGVTIVIGAVTLFYTGVAGLPASIVTDKFQGVMMALLVLTLTIAVCSFKENQVSRADWEIATSWTPDGLMAAVTLAVAIASAELFNQSNWQRVWAAQDVPTMRKGLLLGSTLVFLLMMFFGIMGMLAYAKDKEAYDNFEKLAFLSFFDLLAPMADGWHILVLVFVTALAASTIDSLQTGLASMVSHDLFKLQWNPWWVTRAFLVLVNIPAIWLASQQFSVLELFLVADLVCATAVFPTFLGLQRKDYGILVAPTELGAFGGIVAGMVTVLVNGAVNDVEGGLWSYFWLRNGDICALCGPKTMVTFLITPVVSGVMTYVLSYLDVSIRGDRARQPIFPIPFDKEDDTVHGEGDEAGSGGKEKEENGEMDDDDDDLDVKVDVDDHDDGKVLLIDDAEKGSIATATPTTTNMTMEA